MAVAEEACVLYTGQRAIFLNRRRHRICLFSACGNWVQNNESNSCTNWNRDNNAEEAANVLNLY